MMVAGTLPHLVFFEPTLEFIQYLKRVANNLPIIDVGAGAGFLSRTLHDSGFKVLAIDILERDEPLYDIALLDATIMQFPAACVPVMARPCHNCWVQDTIDNAMQSVPFMLYVGLERNFDGDLYGLSDRYSLTTEPFVAGADGEQVVRISKPATKLPA